MASSRVAGLVALAMVCASTACTDDSLESGDEAVPRPPAAAPALAPRPTADREIDMAAGRFAFLAGAAGALETGSTSWYARAVDDTLTFVPAPSFEGELPPGGFTLTTESIARGSWSWPTEAVFSANADGSASRSSAGVTEWFRGADAGLEQGWTFATAPAASGSIVVRVAIEGAEIVGSDDDGLHLETAAGGVRYGHGEWIDASGERTSVPAVWTGDHIELTVPAETVAGSTFPATLDPIIGPEQMTDAVMLGLDELLPDAAHVACSPTVCMAFWSDNRGARAVRFLENGTLLELPRTVVADPTAEVGGIDFQGNQFMLSWQSGDISAPAVDAQYWSDAGGPVGPVIRIADPAGIVGNSDVACATDRCMVVWRASTGLLSKRIDASGNVLDPLGTSLSASSLGAEAYVVFDGTYFVVGCSSFMRRVTPAGVSLDPAGVMLGFGGQGVRALATNGVNTVAIGVSDAQTFFPNGTVGPVVPLPAAVAQWRDVAWVGSRYLALRGDAVGQALDSNGALLGGTVSFTNLGQNRVGRRPSGGILTSAGSGTLQAQRLDTAAAPVGSTFNLNVGGNPQHAPELVAGNGQYLLAWTDRRLGSWGVYGQRLAPDGSPLDATPVLLLTSTVSPQALAAGFDGTNYLVVRSGANVRGARLPPSGAPLDSTAGLVIHSSSTTVDMELSWDGTNFGLVQMLFSGYTTNSVLFLRISPSGVALDNPAITVVSPLLNLRSVSVAFDGTAHNVVFESPNSAYLRRLSPGATFVGAETTFPQFGFAPLDIGCATGTCVISDGTQAFTLAGAAVATNGSPAFPTACAEVALVGDELVIGAVDPSGNAQMTRLMATAPPVAIGDWFQVDNTAEPEKSMSIAGLGADTMLLAYERFSDLDAASRVYIRAIGSATDGASCGDSVDCASGFCVDGVCCDTQCGNGASDDCLACSIAEGGAVDGVCGPRALGGICRSSVGPCDVAEACDGIATTCPSDALASAVVECRAAATICDAPETCTGSDASCPADLPAAGGVCRPAVGACDVAESCNGADFDCPADGFAALGVVCGPVAGDCDAEDVCDGISSACVDAVLDSSEVCRPQNGACDAEETCDGFGEDCPADEPAADGTDCGGGSVCEEGACVSDPSGGAGEGGSAEGGAGSGDGGAADGGAAVGGSGSGGSPPADDGCQTNPARASHGSWLLFAACAAVVVARRRARPSLEQARGVLLASSGLLLFAMTGCSSGPSELFAGGNAGGDAPSGGAPGTGGSPTSSGGAPESAGGPSAGGSSDGGGGGTPTFCEPREQQPCYDGPAGTDGTGICAAGTTTCLDDGSAFGACEGQVLPAAETCATPDDEDCDGEVNEEGSGCLCVPSSVAACYTGPANTAGVGLCSMGTQTCGADGLGYGPCQGEVVPAAETCNTPADEDCDGQTNEEGAGCTCVPGSSQSCYSAAPSTLGVGICQAGTQTCNANGLGYGPCTGEVTPGTEACNTPVDDDCDGQVNEASAGCVCVPNAFSGCYDGPPATLGVGVCVAGFHQCNAAGTGYGPCSGQVLPSPEDCELTPDEDCDGAAPACNGAHVWSKRFGSAADENLQDIATDSAGNVIVAGSFTGSISLGGPMLTSAGSLDIFVAKLAPDGTHIWSVRFGDFNGQYPRSVITDADDNIIVSGRMDGTVNFGGTNLVGQGAGDLFVVKLSPTGTHLWSKRFGDSAAQDSVNVAVDSADNIIVSGWFEGSINFGGGPLSTAGSSDHYIAKLDPDGNHIWSRRFGNAGSQYELFTAIDGADDVLMTGAFNGADNDWGGPTLTSAGFTDVFVVKLDADGNHLWTLGFGGPGEDYGSSIAVDGSGNVLVVGPTTSPSVDFGGGALLANGSFDSFVVKLDAGGNHVWSRRYGGTGEHEARAVATDSADGVFVVGYIYEGSVDFGGGPLTSVAESDVVVFKLDDAGSHVWSRRFGGTAAQLAYRIAIDLTGNVLIGGSFSLSIDLGGGPLSCVGSTDMFIAKLLN